MQVSGLSLTVTNTTTLRLLYEEYDLILPENACTAIIMWLIHSEKRLGPETAINQIQFDVIVEQSKKIRSYQQEMK